MFIHELQCAGVAYNFNGGNEIKGFSKFRAIVYTVQLLTYPRDAPHHGKRAANKGGRSL